MTTLRKRVARRTKREVFEVYIAFVAVTTGSFYIFFPGQTNQGAIKQAFAPLAPLDTLWNLTWLVGGVLMLIGIWRVHGAKWEQAGLGCVATAVVTYSIAILYVRGTGGLVAIGLNLAIVLACVTRIRFIDALSTAINKAEQMAKDAERG